MASIALSCCNASEKSLVNTAPPIAYPMDEQGMIAAEVVLGIEAVLALMVGKAQVMREQLQARLEALKKEFERGQTELQKVERQRTYLHETVLRISGAIQVLEELLAKEQSGEQNGTGPGDTQPAPTQANEANV